MWFFDSNAGRFTIRIDRDRLYALTLNGSILGRFETAAEAVHAVAECRTGATKWDTVCPATRPTRLSDWVRSIW